LKIINDFKIIPIILLRASLFVVILSVLSKSAFGTYSFLIAVSMGTNRLLDFGTTEGIIAHTISDDYLIKLFEKIKIKFFVALSLVVTFMALSLIFSNEIPSLVLFCGVYLIVFIREYLLSILLTIKEKKSGDFAARPNQLILSIVLQLIFCGIIYLIYGSLLIEQLVTLNLISMLLTIFILFRDQILRCALADFNFINSINIFKDNFHRHIQQIKIAWITVINKLLEYNILFFVIGAEQFALLSLYTAGVGACSFLIKFFRVRTVVIIVAYQKEIIKYRNWVLTFLLFLLFGSSILFIILQSLVSALNVIWFVKHLLLILFLVIPVGVAMCVEWIYIVILRNSLKKENEINKTFLAIGLAYASTFALSFLVLMGVEGYALLYIIAVKDVFLNILITMYIMSQVKYFD